MQWVLTYSKAAIPTWTRHVPFFLKPLLLIPSQYNYHSKPIGMDSNIDAACNEVDIDIQLLNHKISDLHKKNSKARAHILRSLENGNLSENNQNVKNKLAQLDATLQSIDHAHKLLNTKTDNKTSAISFGELKYIMKELGIDMLKESPKEKNCSKASKAVKKRKPYLQYCSSDGISIRLGRSVKDNVFS